MMTRAFVGVLLAVANGVVAQAQTRVGPSVLLSLYSTNATLAATGDGGFVVVWDGTSVDSSSYGLLGVRADGSGNPLGGFLVNTFTTDAQTLPSVAAAANGNFVVVWQGSGAQDGYGEGIFGQRFSASGARLGLEFRVNTTTLGNQRRPSVAIAPDGEFVAVWDSYPNGIFGQRFDAAGVQAGAEFQVSSYVGGMQYRASVAVNGAGDFAVVWNTFGQDGWGSGVSGQRFDSSGARLGTEFQVNTYTTGNQVDPAVALAGGDGFVVVWTDYQQGEISGQRFDSDGAPVGGEFVVNAHTTGSQVTPAAASDPNGGFVVVWSVQDLGTQIHGQRFDSAGARRGREFRVDAHPNGGFLPSVAMTGADAFVCAWGEFDSQLRVFLQRFDRRDAEHDARALDFHADGTADLLWSHRSTGQVYLWRMSDSSPTTFSPVATVSDLNWRIVAGGDLNADGKGDLVWRNVVTGQVYAWIMDGAAIAASLPVATVGDANWVVVASGDTDGDGKADLVWRHRSTGQVYVWRMNGASIASTLPIATVGDLDWRILGSRDFNGDGRSDLLWRHLSSGHVYLWFLNGASILSSGTVALTTDPNMQIVAAGDFSGDGRADLLWRHDWNGQVSVWYLNGTTTTASFPLTTFPVLDNLEWRVAANGDFNGDGRQDVLGYNVFSGESVVIMLTDHLGSTASSVLPTVAERNWAPQGLR